MAIPVGRMVQWCSRTGRKVPPLYADAIDEADALPRPAKSCPDLFRRCVLGDVDDGGKSSGADPLLNDIVGDDA